MKTRRKRKGFVLLYYIPLYSGQRMQGYISECICLAFNVFLINSEQFNFKNPTIKIKM